MRIARLTMLSGFTNKQASSQSKAPKIAASMSRPLQTGHRGGNGSGVELLVIEPLLRTIMAGRGQPNAATQPSSVARLPLSKALLGVCRPLHGGASWKGSPVDACRSAYELLAAADAAQIVRPLGSVSPTASISFQPRTAGESRCSFKRSISPTSVGELPPASCFGAETGTTKTREGAAGASRPSHSTVSAPSDETELMRSIAPGLYVS